MAAKTKESTKKVATKKSQEASKKFFFMNVEFKGNESAIMIGETRDVRLKYVDEDNFLAIERAKRPADGPSQKRTTLDRTAHGKISVDDYGAHVYFYFPFTEFDKNTWLAEALESEAELMGDRIVEMEAIC